MLALQSLEFSFLYFLQELRTPFLDEVVPVFTSLGDKGLIFVALGAVLFIIPRTRKMGFIILLSLAAGFILGNGIIKNLVMRDRPCWIEPGILLLIENPHDYSFPSGHTLAAFETAVSIFLINRRWGIPALIFAALMGLSRMYLFVHFPSDVLSGMALGIFIAWFVSRCVEKYKIYDILILQIKKKAE